MPDKLGTPKALIRTSTKSVCRQEERPRRHQSYVIAKHCLEEVAFGLAARSRRECPLNQYLRFLLWTSHCIVFFCCGAWALGAWTSVVAHRFSCSTACGIFPDQGSNPTLSPTLAGGFLVAPLYHQGSLVLDF